MLLPHAQDRRCPVGLRRECAEDGAIRRGRRRAGAGRDRLVEDDGRGGVPGRVTDREPKLVRGTGVTEEADGPQRLAGRWLVGALCQPRAERWPALADLDCDILDAGQLILPGP